MTNLGNHFKRSIPFFLAITVLASCSSTHKTHRADFHKHLAHHGGIERTIPTGKSGKIISREGYVLQYNKACKISHWVSYQILSENLVENFERQDDFAPDELLDANQATLEDYEEPVYDRGHLARARLFTRSPKLMSESFRLSNMVPQDPYMNESGAWRRSEDFEYDIAKNNNKILVVSGPILSTNPKVIGQGKVCVPQAVFKVIFNPQTNEGIGFIIPNHKEEKNFQSYVKSIDEVESATGLDLFHEVDDSTENRMETQADISNWHFTNMPTKKHHWKNKSTSSSNEEPVIKKSKSGYCHIQGSRYYSRTKHFESFNSIDECKLSGGTLP